MIKYIVEKMQTKIEIDYGWSTREIRLTGCAGYIPVFDTLEEAEKHADNKYKISKIEVGVCQI